MGFGTDVVHKSANECMYDGISQDIHALYYAVIYKSASAIVPPMIKHFCDLWLWCNGDFPVARADTFFPRNPVAI